MIITHHLLELAVPDKPLRRAAQEALLYQSLAFVVYALQVYVASGSCVWLNFMQPINVGDCTDIPVRTSSELNANGT